MGVNDREWMREARRHEMQEQFNPLIVKALIVINALIFIPGFLKPELVEQIDRYLAYSFYSAFHEGALYQLLTYQFVHANTGHIVLNMLCLWVFGPGVERQFGKAKFLLFYLVCGIAAALFSSLLGGLGLYEYDGLPKSIWAYIPMVGASGSIYGVIAACAVLFPRARIMLLFPPIELSVRTFALGVLGIAMLVIFFNWNNAGGEAGHMGGMLMGFVIMGVRHLWVKLNQSRHHY